MWRSVIPLVLLIGPGVATAGETSRVVGWVDVNNAAEKCAVKIVRQRLPKGLDAVPHGPAYRFDRRTTAEKRQCFYRQLNMGEAEQVLREMQFEKK